MLELKGYITNLGKYNEGKLIGEWVTFPIDEEGIENVCKRIGINEEYEEYFFTDWDCEVNFGFGEYVSIEEVNRIAEALENWEDDEKLFEAACEIWDAFEVVNNDPCEYMLLSDVNNDSDLGYYWIEESGCYDLRNLGNLSNYIDYESFGRDVRFESNGGFTCQGWVEYTG